MHNFFEVEHLMVILALHICFLSGFENNAIYNDLEENVAITTFGKENKILCHLTNDYGLLRDSIGTVPKSPLFLTFCSRSS